MTTLDHSEESDSYSPIVPRLHGVDALRGISILAVILLHIRIAFHFDGTEIGVSLLHGLGYQGPLWFWIMSIVLLAALLGALPAHFFSEPMNRRLRGACRQQLQDLPREPSSASSNPSFRPFLPAGLIAYHAID